MKTYVCDSCKTIINNPYEIKMKEFYYGTEFDFGFAFPIERKIRGKIHLCDKCFSNLKYIAEQKRGDTK